MNIDIATAPLDMRCKAILSKMKVFGYDQPDTPYIADIAEFPEGDLSYLMRNGGMSIETEQGTYFGSVLGNYAKSMVGGPDAGKIGFKLKVGLA
ncbi:hypothetical protein [Burkholderia vietnamiensis]|uniref:hypothetical protein n=1 Tax=Burkholderia vietnamiensis TaxID=60552 RepID=UPI00264F556A|nr:hypothetical protein [Burkholderia vietnamiensis]MDN8035776.1 hypothetical protein [Burkholderia vietnamiensis]